MPLKRLLVLAAVVAMSSPLMAGTRDRDAQESPGLSPFVLAPRAVPGLELGQSSFRPTEPFRVGTGGAVAIFEADPVQFAAPGRRPDGIQFVYVAEEVDGKTGPSQRSGLKIFAIKDDGSTTPEGVSSGKQGENE